MLLYRCSGETRHQQNSFQVACNSVSSSNLFYSGTLIITTDSFISWLCGCDDHPSATCSCIYFSVLAVHRLFYLLFIEKTQIFPYMKT